MKRHENLYSAIAAFAAAVGFLVFGIVVNILLSPFLDKADIGYFVFRMVPLSLMAVAVVFAIIGAYSLINERRVENGEAIEATVTGVNEYFVGKTTEIVHYNVYCEAVINGRKYRFSKKNIEYDPSSQLKSGKVFVKIDPKNPMQYYIML